MSGPRSGGLGEGDGEAEGLELPDVVAGFLVGAAGVVAGAEVVVAGGRVSEQVPGDHQDAAGDGDEGFELAAALDQAPVTLAENVSVFAAAVAASPRTPLR